MMQSPYQQYKEQSLATMARGEILVKLFDETIKQLNWAQRAIGENDLATANDTLTKACGIVLTLNDALDMRFPVSGYLRDMYIFLAGQIREANLRKDASIIEECMPIFKELRDTFEQAEKISRQNQVRVAAGAK